MAVIGCGAAAKEFCFPVLAKYPNFRRDVVVVDRTASQAEAVAAKFGIQNYATDYRSLPIDVDAAIVMTPHAFHAEQSIHFLRQGKPVFVEKPLGMSAAEVAEMLEASSSGNAILMVNNCRRLFPAYARVRELIQSEEYGAVLSINISDGSPFDWNSVSSFYLRDPQAARGVFLDRGAHTVDVVCWWLSGNPQVIDARYDAMGGAEGLMKVQLACGQTKIQLTFSRLYKLENCFTVQCERAQIRGRLFNASAFEVERDGNVELIHAGQGVLYHEYAQQLVDNFIDVVQGRASPWFTAVDVAPSISVIDQAYQRATAFEFPWYEADPNIAKLRAAAKYF